MTDPSREALVLRGVGHRYLTGTRALADIDLGVRRGEFLSLLGPSGCGKSTVLRLIAGLLAPSEGTLAWSEARHRVGVVFQEPTLMPWASTFDNVRLPLKLARVPREEAQARVRAALERVGLAEFANAYPRELSGGMRMRVALARALVTGPDLLLLDEPFAALDEITRFRLNDDLLRLWEQLGKTVIFVTHSVFESVYLSNRIVVMTARPGRVFAELTVDEPAPRGEAFRTSPAYAEICRRVSASLRAAMAEGERR